MAFIKSISGIRGTIGGKPGENLTPVDIIKYTASFGSIMSQKKKNPKIVVGRDGRISGSMVRNLVVNTLTGVRFSPGLPPIVPLIPEILLINATDVNL